MQSFLILFIKLFYSTLLIISCIPFCASEIKNIHIVDDSRPMILFEHFGFSQYGHVSISLKDVSWISKHQKDKINPSSVGFFLVRDPLLPKLLNESFYKVGFCVLQSNYIKLIFNFQKLMRTKSRIYNDSITIREADGYNLFFGNCQPEFKASMHVHTEMYNIQYGERDFLPSGQTCLPKFYFLFFWIYFSFFLIWVFNCVKQKQNVNKIHWIMCALLFVKALKMICAFEDKLYVGKTGTPHGWDVAFYIFGFFKGIMLFTVIVLIGTGWSFLKPYLQEREKRVLMIVIPLQVLENVVAFIIGETSPATKDRLTWNQIFLLIDIICCCAVFFPIIWSIRSLREASGTDGKAAKNLEKLTLFKQFYAVLIVYLYFTRVVVLAIGALMSYKYEWIIIASAEVASFAFYVYIFYNFQPLEKNPYLVIDDQDESFASSLKLNEEGDDSFEL